MVEKLARLAHEIEGLEKIMESLYKKEGTFLSARMLALSVQIDVLVARHLALQVRDGGASARVGPKSPGHDVAAG